MNATDIGTPMQQLWQRCHDSPIARWQLEFVLRLAGAEAASIMLLDEAGDNLVFCQSLGSAAVRIGTYDEALRVSMSASVGIAPLVVLFGHGICMAEGDPRHNPEVDRRVGSRTRALCSQPLSTSERVLGTLNVLNPHGDAPEGSRWRFQADDLEAIQAATACVGLWLNREWENLSCAPTDLRTR